jgi:ABC-type Zn uptake system ZnuABC Zn-binding protein ZnuA
MVVAYRGFPVILLPILAVLGCGKAQPAAPVPPAKVRVVATAYPLASIASQVGAAAVQCDWIAEQGQSLDAVDPTPEVHAKIRQGEMILTSGFGEEWAVEGFDDPMRARSIVRLDVLPAAKSDAGCRQLWLDPAVAKELASAIAERLVIRQPEPTAQFRENARKFVTDVDAITSEFFPKLQSLKDQNVLVLSSDYSALLRRLGLHEIRPVTAAPLRLSDEDMPALRKAIRDNAPIALLVEVGIPPAVQQDLSTRLAVPVVTLDSLGTSAGVGRNSYQAILRYDLEQLSTLQSAQK